MGQLRFDFSKSTHVTADLKSLAHHLAYWIIAFASDMVAGAHLMRRQPLQRRSCHCDMAAHHEWVDLHTSLYCTKCSVKSLLHHYNSIGTCFLVWD